MLSKLSTKIWKSELKAIEFSIVKPCSSTAALPLTKLYTFEETVFVKVTIALSVFPTIPPMLLCPRRSGKDFVFWIVPTLCPTTPPMFDI